MQRITVIAPHFDDCEIGVGGYIAKLKESSTPSKVIVGVMCNGSYVVSHSQELLHPASRYVESQKASQLLGVDELVPLNLGTDNNLLQVPYGDMVPIIDEFLMDTTPDVLLIPMKSCNPDHTATFQVCMAALRPQRCLPCTVYAYEYPLSNWGEGSPQSEIMGRTYVPLTADQLQRKVDSVLAYASQTAGREQSVAGEAGVRALARMRGLECGAEYAELLYLVRDVL